MKKAMLICVLLLASVHFVHAAKDAAPGPGPMFDPNAKKGLTGILAQPQTTTIKHKIKVTLFSFLPAGEKCEVYFNYPGLQYGPVKLLVDKSPYQVPDQYAPAFNQAGDYYISAYTGTVGEHPCPHGKHVKTKVMVKSATRFQDPPVVTQPKKFNPPGPIKEMPTKQIQSR